MRYHMANSLGNVWIVHAPPRKTLVATHATGDDGGDPDLVAAVRRYSPRLVLSGHVHSPLHWREHRDATLFLNPGRSTDGPFPNHILVRTSQTSCQLVTAPCEDTPVVDFAVTGRSGAENATAAVA